MTSFTPSHKAHGFTLIEVIVALMVLALGISGAAKLIDVGYQHLSATANLTRAALLADTHLTSLTSNPDLQAGRYAGQYDDQFTWNLRLTKLDSTALPDSVSALPDNILALRADLSVTAQLDSRSLDFHTLILVEQNPLP